MESPEKIEKLKASAKITQGRYLQLQRDHKALQNDYQSLSEAVAAGIDGLEGLATKYLQTKNVSMAQRVLANLGAFKKNVFKLVSSRKDYSEEALGKMQVQAEIFSASVLLKRAGGKVPGDDFFADLVDPDISDKKLLSLAEEVEGLLHGVKTATPDGLNKAMAILDERIRDSAKPPRV